MGGGGGVGPQCCSVTSDGVLDLVRLAVYTQS